MKCKVCGKDFELKLDNHYIARDEEVKRTGLSAMVGSNNEQESKLYDTFDCPFCGCQNIVQERKRSFVMARDYIPDEELEKCDEEVEVSKAEEDKCDRDCKGCWGEYVCEEAKRKESEEDKETEEVAEEVKENKETISCFGSYNYEDCDDIDCECMPECKKAKEEEMKRILERRNKENKENEVNKCY